jgi:hypothetical protein
MNDLPPQAATCAKRLADVRRALFGDLSNARQNRLRDIVRGFQDQGGDVFHRKVSDTRRAVIELALADHTLAPMALARLAQAEPHRAILWMSIEVIRMTILNPTMDSRPTQGHADAVRDISGTIDNPYGMVVRCMEALWSSTAV